MKKISFVLFVCMLMFLLPLSVFAELKTGDVFVMGQFEQDDNTGNGNEPIEWLVLAAEDDRVLVISRYSLAAKMFHYPKTETPWENSNMRKWLNDEFFNSAFEPEEQKRIIPAWISTPDNPVYHTDGGNDTEDRLFLLSLDEAETYFASDEERLVQTTEYSKKHGAFIRGNGMSEWWLRSPGKAGGYAAIVSSLGKVNKDGNSLNNVSCTVRPAFWLALSDDYEPPAPVPTAGPEPILLTGTIDLTELSESAPEEKVPEILSLDEAEAMGLTIPVPAEGEFIYLGEAKSDQAERMLAVFTMDPAVSELRNVNILIYKAVFESGGVKADDLTLSVKTESSYPIADGQADGGSFSFNDVEFTDWGASAQFSFTLNLPQPAGFSFTFDPVDMTIVRQGGSAAAEAAAPEMADSPENPTSAGLSVGNHFMLGRYEQDGKLSSGPEPVEWRVLSVEDGYALAVSEYGLDARVFHNSNDEITWYECKLREWLNGEFLTAVFSEPEQSLLLKEDDSLFLLSTEEAKNLFGSDEDRLCTATAFAVSHGAYIHEDTGKVWWWLRSQSSTNNNSAACVRHDGSVTSSGNGVIFKEVIRPAFYLDLEAYADYLQNGPVDTEVNEQPAEEKTVMKPYEPGPAPVADVETDAEPYEPDPTPSADVVKIPEDLEAGDVFAFGRYEQDDDSDDGAEPIEWLTLAVEGKRALVVSLNILDSLPYHAKGGPVNWQNCSLREWLNGEFFGQAFSQAEKDRIRESRISDPGNELFGTKKSPDTKDLVFLPDINEADKYFESDEDRSCEATDHAKAEGIFVDQNDGRSWWWLRTAGKSDSDAAYVGVVGWIMERGNFVENPYVGVRPAMWLWLTDEAAAEGDSDHLTVNQPGDVGVLLRKTPSFSGDILRSIMNGTEVLPLGDSRKSEGRNWIHIQTKEGLEGWIPETALGD